METQLKDESALLPLKHKAQLLFVEEGITLMRINEVLEIPMPTLLEWSKNDKWQTRHTMRMLSADKLVVKYYEVVERVLNEMLDGKRQLETSEVNQLLKFSTCIEKLHNKISPHVVMQVLIEFCRYLQQANPGLANPVIQEQEVYVKKLLREA